MKRLAEHVKNILKFPAACLETIFSEDFRKLLVLCLKMLFRKSTRKRFVCLVVAFLIMMGFNTFGYVMKFHKSEMQKKNVLGEKAFKVFFLRMRTRNNFAIFFSHQYQKIKDLGSELVKQAFIYQNNLFVHFFSPPKTGINDATPASDGMDLIYRLFDIKDFANGYYLSDSNDGYQIKIKCNYIDYNGARLNQDMIDDRHRSLKFDLIDIADMIRGNVQDKRIEVFNSIRKEIIANINRVPPAQDNEPNPYLSRVESIIPMSFLHIWTNVKNDNTTDIVDLTESVTYQKDSTIATDKIYLGVPERYRESVMYEDIDIYPRYIPFFISDLLKPQWNWLLMYQDINIKSQFVDYIEQLHFKGHYLFSYEKSQIIKDRVKKINDDIHSNHINFYLTDLSMGIAFPFMISLFAFIHLKTEIAFLLMFKNKIRELLFIFWLLPVSLIMFVKGGMLAAYLLYLFSKNFGLTVYIGLPLSISFLLAAVVFYPINRWCFSQFTGDTLNLHALHKGR